MNCMRYNQHKAKGSNLFKLRIVNDMITDARSERTTIDYSWGLHSSIATGEYNIDMIFHPPLRSSAVNKLNDDHDQSWIL